MKAIFTFFCSMLAMAAFAQKTISGTVVNPKGKPVDGANIFIEGSYDGATSDANGVFSFTTTSTGKQILVITAINFESVKLPLTVEDFVAQIIKMRENVNVLDAVIVTAGTFEAGERARVSVLKPLDIVTTAGSSGDIVAALLTLPGTQTVGEDGRLFVRGGEADETQTYVDGVRVAQPYSPTANNLPTRGRFSPFLFSGISFSTGGYSAEFGEALSSVLLLNTQGEPDQSKTDIALMTVGLGLGHTRKWDKSSVSFNLAYTDLAPYQVAVPERVDWNRPYQSLAGETVYRYRFTNGMLKMYAAFDATRFDLNQESINTGKTRIDMNTNNFYLNTSYKGSIGNAWQIATGISYGFNQNKIAIALDDADNNENAAHLKLKFKKTYSERFKLSVGADYFITRFADSFTEDGGAIFSSGYTAGIAAVFTEADLAFSQNFAAKVGIRTTYNNFLEETEIAPRVSLAYKVSKKGQFSFAYGDFTQAPKAEYLKFGDRGTFDNEKASHYILNYQYSNEKQTFRAEAYYKQYDDLVRYDTEFVQSDSDFSNSGDGFAKGLDLFWRDGKTIKSLEYWVSYSYIDTERNYRNFPVHATPGFVADHNLSVVTKYWIDGLRSQIGLTNTYSTGRPYNNPNQTAFMASKTKSYNNLSFSWAYLLGPQKILYFSISNVLGTQNVFGYEYATMAGDDGNFARRAILPAADRFFFVGFFWTISDDKKSNQLNNL